MRPEEIVARLREQPFRGLRIHISDGQSYDVTHPELLLVTRTIVHIALPPVVHGVATGRSVYCDPIHVTRIEPLDGRKRRKGAKSRKA
jgi:hypothetical protein